MFVGLLLRLDVLVVVVAEVIEFGLGVEQFEPDVAVALDDVAGVDETVVVRHAVVEME